MTRAPWKTQLLLNYASICLMGHLLLATVYAIYLLVWALGGEQTPGWPVLAVLAVLLLGVTIANTLSLYHCAAHDEFSRRRQRFLAGQFGVLAALYLVVMVVASNPVFAWIGGITGAVMLPLPLLLLRPGVVEAVRALPEDEDDQRDPTDWF